MDLEQTIDLPSRDTAGEQTQKITQNSVFELQPVRASTNISQGFNESTRKLLRQRMMIAAIATLCFLITIKIVVVLFGETTLYDFMTRLTASILLAGVIVHLYRTPKISLRRLRIIELVVGIALTAECTWILIAETQNKIANNGLNELPALFVALSFVFAIFIAIYGMFIPSNWRRTVFITCLAALIPTITATVLRQCYPVLQSVENFPGFAAPTLTMVMAMVATLASHVVHQVRREIEKAKQYGQYQLLEEIGQGGMGVVYKAKHRMLKRPAAIKLIRNEIADDPATIAEFEQEVQLSAELTHWNSVQIYDYGRNDIGDFFYVMEYLEGETLLSRILASGKLSNKETVDFISQVCCGLQEAHLKGMVHRDIKPANIFLSNNSGQEDVVKILDFGLATMKTDTKRLQKISGTPAYMSPEQIKAEAVDERTDIYALGCIVFECLTGEQLFQGESFNDLFVQHLHQKPVLDRLPESASKFRDVIGMCLEKDPKKRFSNVSALRNALASCH